MLLLAASLLFTNPAPLEMPRAEGHLVTEGGRSRFEDRYSRIDLWVSRTVDGRWIDEDGRVLLLLHLDAAPPRAVAAETTVTRVDALKAAVPIDRRDRETLRETLAALTQLDLDERGRRPRQTPRGFDDVRYWQGTNETVVVCSWLRETATVWEAAVWRLAEGDEIEICEKVFEEEIFDRSRAVPWTGVSRGEDERKLLRADARHSVTNYAGWQVTETEDYVVLDDLPRGAEIVTAFTNAMARLHPAFVKAIPPVVDATNSLNVVRLFADRAEYLEALAADGLTNMAWSAAYWSPARRELVAYLPPDGGEELLRTLCHEAFHQYLSYVTAFEPVSPWLNEGYAQFFEDPSDESCGTGFAALSEKDLESLADALPSLLFADYREFYAGEDGERSLHYALAKSFAVFLERGAPKVRFEPFRNLKRDYFAELLRSHDMRKATAAAFRNEEGLKRFAAEWLRFWKER